MTAQSEIGRRVARVATAAAVAGVLAWSSSLDASAPPGRFVATADTVTDAGRGLTWQRNVPSGSYDWAGAMAYCQGLNLGGFATGWRVPTVKELVSIVDYTTYGPAIDSVVFPATPGKDFWTSTPSVNIGNDAWVVFFDYGYTSTRDKVYTPTPTVRCVR